MKALVNYWLILFVIGNIIEQYILLNPWADFIFYPLLGLSILLLVINIQTVLIGISKYRFILLYIVAIWLYQLIFGINQVHEKTWSYLIAKTVILLMTVVAIERNFSFYKERFYSYALFFSVALLLLGIIFFDRVNQGRHFMGFVNPNEAGHLAAICAGAFIIGDFLSPKKWLTRILMLISIYATLLSGSRSSLGVVIVAFFIRYGFSIKVIFPLIVAGMSLFVFLPAMNLNLSGVNRFTETIENRDFSGGREEQREAAWVMINEKPITGNGIYPPRSKAALEITDLGSHNAFLDFLSWYGYPFGCLLVFSLIIASISFFFRFINTEDKNIKIHLFVVCSTVATCFFEGYIHGVNELTNTMFFTSMAVLYRYKYLEKSDY